MVTELLPTLATTGGYGIPIGTANNSDDCWFARVINANEHVLTRITADDMEGRYAAEFTRIFPTLNYRKNVIERFIEEMMDDDYAAHFNMVWLPQEQTTYLPDAVLEEALAEQAWFTPVSARIGIDVGKSDRTVATFSLNGRTGEQWIEDIMYVPGLAYPDQYRMIGDWIEKKKITALSHSVPYMDVQIEDNGVGEPMVDAIRQRMVEGGHVIPVTGYRATHHNRPRSIVALHNAIWGLKMRFNPKCKHWRKAFLEMRDVKKLYKGEKLTLTHSDIVPSLICAFNDRRVRLIEHPMVDS